MTSLLEKHRDSYILYSKTNAFKNKVSRTKELILKALNNHVNPYIAVSTGKDSVCMLGLIYEMDSTIDIMFHDSGVELPDSYILLNNMRNAIIDNDKLHIIKSPIDVLEEYKKKDAFLIGADKDIAWTVAMMNPIKGWAKEENKDLAFIGLRKQESARRRKMLCKNGTYFYCKSNKIQECFPMAEWKGEDIWAYLLTHEKLKNYIHPAYYKDRLVSDPAKIRVSWFCDPTMATRGSFLWLKLYYNDVFNNLCVKFPEIKSFV